MKKIIICFVSRIWLLVLLVTQFTGLYAQPSVPVKGTLLKAELIGSYDVNKMDKIVNEELQAFLEGSPMPFENFKGKFDRPRYGMQLFKLTYQTSIPEKANKKVVATGLVAIPSGLNTAMPVISYQHGTVFGKDQVPSQPDKSMETKLILAQFGSQGYVVIGADYIGLGDSQEPNSYMCRKSTEEACMDMYKAAMQFLKKRNVAVGSFFTMGWSQGAYNNMLFLRRLEQSNIPVTASVTASAPVDLNFFITRGVGNPRPFDAPYTPACLSNLVFAVSEYFSLPDLPKQIIKPEYLDIARDFYQFKVDWFTYLKKSTPAVTDFVKPAFITEMKNGTGKFTALLNSMEAYRWVSTTALRAYTGGLDEAVPDYLARLAVEYQSALGKMNGSYYSAGDKADHRATYVFAVIDAKPWFDSFLKK